MHNITRPATVLWYILRTPDKVVGHGSCGPDNVLTTPVEILEVFDGQAAQEARLAELGFDDVHPEADLSLASVERQRHILKHRVDVLRAAKMEEPLLFEGDAYDTGAQSASNVVGVLITLLAGAVLPEGFTWRTRDNRDVPFTSRKVAELAAAGSAERSRLYQVSWALKAAIDASGEPLTVDITNAWGG